MQTLYFENINFSLPYNRIYSRLGYSPNRTKLTQATKEEIDLYIEEVRDYIVLKGALRVLAFKMEGNKIYIDKGRIIWESNNLSDFLKDADQILLVAASAGEKISFIIEELQKKNLIRKAAVFDAAASEVVDDCLTWLQRYILKELIRQNKTCSARRYSAGYGDFSLVYQKDIVDLLKLNKIGIRINENFILIPEKSVTALMAIYNK